MLSDRRPERRSCCSTPLSKKDAGTETALDAQHLAGGIDLPRNPLELDVYASVMISSVRHIPDLVSHFQNSRLFDSRNMIQLIHDYLSVAVYLHCFFLSESLQRVFKRSLYGQELGFMHAFAFPHLVLANFPRGRIVPSDLTLR